MTYNVFGGTLNPTLLLMEFKKGIFQAWKVTENDCGHGKSLKSHEIPPIGHGIF